MNSPRFEAPPQWSLSSTERAEARLEDLDRASRRSDPPAVFYAELLETLADALGATAVEQWAVAPNGFDPAGRVAPLRQATVGPPPTEAVDALRRDGAAAWTAADGPRVAAAIPGVRGPSGALAAALPERATDAAREAAVDLLRAVAEVAERYELRRLAVDSAESSQRHRETSRLVARLLQTSTADDVARAAADALGAAAGERRRVAVLLRRRGGWRVAALSGSRGFSPRADAVRRIERMADTTLAAGEALWRAADGATTIGPPEDPAAATPAPPVLQASDLYADQTDTAAWWIAPFTAPDEPNAANLALLVEAFEGGLEPELPRRLAPLGRLAAAAAAREPAGPVDTLVRRLRSHATAMLAAAAAILAAALVLFGSHGSLEVTVDGQLVPANSARVFAPRDAIVSEVLVDHGDKVSPGQPLVRLRSEELEVKREELAEAIALTKQELAALQTEKLSTRANTAESASETAALAARQVALAEQLTHQQRRAELLDEQARRLEVVSPLAGTVTSWRPHDYLDGRAVGRGERLLEIAATEGPKRLELLAPDELTGRVLQAHQEGPLKIRYVLQAAPGREHAAVVQRIAASTTLNAKGRPVVRIEAAPQGDAPPDARGQSRVTAKIDCGRHRLAMVWFYEAWDAARRAWF
ncbi:biotin/lipoyl-binding protein [Botrimarina sp.]|uniref:biotin/lipoyl-binding protein n=1 Tax=Botrimarina sp. TaxID=2795802 RepID=UPI0032EC8428